MGSEDRAVKWVQQVLECSTLLVAQCRSYAQYRKAAWEPAEMRGSAEWHNYEQKIRAKANQVNATKAAVQDQLSALSRVISDPPVDVSVFALTGDVDSLRSLTYEILAIVSEVVQSIDLSWKHCSDLIGDHGLGGRLLILSQLGQSMLDPLDSGQ
eukprot:Clim_evm21s25 gene=Clim_evmTU21s25